MTPHTPSRLAMVTSATSDGDDVPFERERESYEQPGYQSDGFVTGGSVYLRALLKWFKPLGLRAVIDMHSLPGGSVRNMGYTGRYFEHAEFFNGSEAWLAACASATHECLPPEGTGSNSYLRKGVLALRALALLVANLEEEEATSGVVVGIAPWNEALFADDVKAASILPPFIKAVVPLLRHTLPAPRYEIYLNFFNNGLDWAQWMDDHATVLGPQAIAELHIYHAFDPPSAVSLPFVPTTCPMCTDGPHGMRSLICKTCGSDAEVLAKYQDRKVPYIIGEWSIGTCNMWGTHPATIVDPEYARAPFELSFHVARVRSPLPAGDTRTRLRCVRDASTPFTPGRSRRTASSTSSMPRRAPCLSPKARGQTTSGPPSSERTGTIRQPMRRMRPRRAPASRSLQRRRR